MDIRLWEKKYFCIAEHFFFFFQWKWFSMSHDGGLLSIRFILSVPPAEQAFNASTVKPCASQELLIIWNDCKGW